VVAFMLAHVDLFVVSLGIALVEGLEAFEAAAALEPCAWIAPTETAFTATAMMFMMLVVTVVAANEPFDKFHECLRLVCFEMVLRWCEMGGIKSDIPKTRGSGRPGPSMHSVNVSEPILGWLLPCYYPF
jgi:hypothetical protein